jgi:SAM-dependent methyltransferase
MPHPPAADFYDALAPFYHLNYADWEASVGVQARALDTLLRDHGVAAGATVLDAACGIGTQSLGLAALGYRVTGSDLAPEAVERARAEAAARDLEVAFSVADMRGAAEHHGRTFDAVIACDNALPHLLSDAEILAALRQFHRCTAPGGVCLVSVRDYARETRSGVQARAPVVHDEEGVRRVAFQVWEFTGSLYDLSLYLVDDRAEGEPRTRVMRARYYAVTLDVLARLLAEAGFEAVARLDEPFYQPVLVGRRPAEP